MKKFLHTDAPHMPHLSREQQHDAREAKQQAGANKEAYRRSSMEMAMVRLKAHEEKGSTKKKKKKQIYLPKSMLPKLVISQSDTTLTKRIIEINNKPPFTDPLLMGKGVKCRMNDKLLKEAKRGDAEGIQIALRAGANPSVKDVYGFTPLCYTCMNDHMDATRLLVEFKANINQKSRFGNTPLIYSASSGRVRMMRFLMSDEHNPRVQLNHANSKGLTALHVATIKNQLESMMVLTSTPKIDVDVHDNEGWTPLMYACRDGKMGCVKLLINRGCNINLINNKGEKPIDMARIHERNDIWGLLYDHPASGKTSKWGANKSPYPNLVDVKFCIAPDDLPAGMDDAQMEVRMWQSDHTEDSNYDVNLVTQKEKDHDNAHSKKAKKRRRKAEKEFRNQITTLQLMQQGGIDIAKCTDTQLEEYCGAKEGSFADGKARRALGLLGADAGEQKRKENKHKRANAAKKTGKIKGDPGK